MNLEEKNVGVFIDVENVSHNDLPYIMIEAKKFGRIIVNRLYADWTSPIVEKWKQYLITYGLEPIHCAKIPKKNSVDIKMIDDIYDILYFTRTVDIYILVSNDIDYLTCSRKIRLLGKYLVSFGYGNCSQVLRNVSDKFVNIDLLNMNEDSIEKEKEKEKDKLDLDVFNEVDVEIRKFGDNFVDKMFEVMNGKRHKSYIEFCNQMEERGFCMENFEDEIDKYSKYFTIGITKNKKKIYDITSINLICDTIYEEIAEVFQINCINEMLMPQLKEKIVCWINNFDQRLWGFNRFKDMIMVVFSGKLEVVDRGSSQYVINLMD